MILLFVIQVCVILFVAELLIQHVPPHLREYSRENCYRMDGSLSVRRRVCEQRAARKVRLDLSYFLLYSVGHVEHRFSETRLPANTQRVFRGHKETCSCELET
jgi:hypothetical protein